MPRLTQHLRSAFYLTWLSATRSPKRAILRGLKRQQQLSRNEVEALQQRLLARLLRHARENVPYYSKLLARPGIADDEAVDMESFSKLPTLDKGLIRSHFADLQSGDLDQRTWYNNTSGGSTGEPSRFIQDMYYDHCNVAVKMLFDSWSGYEPGMARVLLWGSERDVLGGSVGKRTRFRRWLRNDHFINTFDFTIERKHEAVRLINKLKPVQILAYVESALELAKFIESESLNVHAPRAVMTSAGVLSPEARETIGRAFGARVFDRYGSREVGGIGAQLPEHDEWFIPPSIHYVEVVDEAGRPLPEGEEGEIAVTVLTNYAMPLIRYRIGDRGALGTISQNEPGVAGSWPRLVSLTGRTTDLFVKRDGTTVHGEFFCHLFYFKQWVEKFQIVQESHTGIKAYVVATPGDRSPRANAQTLEGEIQEIRDQVHTVMGKECEFSVEFVDDIPKSASGKFRYTISHVAG